MPLFYLEVHRTNNLVNAIAHEDISQPDHK